MQSILLVDDEPMILRVMRLALEKVGYQVNTAIDGEEALEKIVADPRTFWSLILRCHA